MGEAGKQPLYTVLLEAAGLKQLLGTQRQLGCQARDPALASLFGIPVIRPLLSADTLHLFHGYSLIL